MFKPGDILTINYCSLYQVISPITAIIIDGDLLNTEGVVFNIRAFPNLILAFDTPDALYIPNHDPHLFGIEAKTFSNTNPCSCDIVILMQRGCSCGGR